MNKDNLGRIGLVLNIALVVAALTLIVAIYNYNFHDATDLSSPVLKFGEATPLPARTATPTPVPTATATPKPVAELYQDAKKLADSSMFETAIQSLDHIQKSYPAEEKKLKGVRADYEGRWRKSLLKAAKELTGVPQSSNDKIKLLLSKFPGSFEAKEAERLKEQNDEALAEAEARKGAQLELVSRRGTWEYGYATVEGQVKNLTSVPLKNIQAQATWYTKDGQMITSDSAMIDYNPIMPGQTSPFKVMSRHNPLMDKFLVEMKVLFGGTVNTYAPPNKPSKKKK